VVGKTTHVVQNKRNTAKGLQALINGKYIVQDSYINALVYAATPSDLENLESLSPLEEDFYAAWPDPRLHFPPAGKEPIQRPAAAFAPNPTRLYVFEGFTFVFCDAAQFENLQAPINNGHGKALLYAIENGKTTATELVQFMRNAAGRKGARGDDDENGKAVLVRFRAKGSYEEWSVELGNQVALMMDRRVIEQSEFLDAILGNDASPLCRALPREEQETPNESDVRPSSHANTPPEVLSHEQPASQLEVDSSQAPKKPATRQRVGTFQSKVKTFDDGFDMDSIPTYTLDETVTEGPREASPVSPPPLLNV
jgi:nibrin-like protein